MTVLSHALLEYFKALHKRQQKQQRTGRYPQTSVFYMGEIGEGDRRLFALLATLPHSDLRWSRFGRRLFPYLHNMIPFSHFKVEGKKISLDRKTKKELFEVLKEMGIVKSANELSKLKIFSIYHPGGTRQVPHPQLHVFIAKKGDPFVYHFLTVQRKEGEKSFQGVLKTERKGPAPDYTLRVTVKEGVPTEVDLLHIFGVGPGTIRSKKNLLEAEITENPEYWNLIREGILVEHSTEKRFIVGVYTETGRADISSLREVAATLGDKARRRGL